MGTTFTRAITQVPVCNASRSSVFTGQQPSQTGILDNYVPWYERVDPPTRFRLNYNTGKGLTAHDDALHAVVRTLLVDRLADEHVLISDGKAAVTGTAADELIVGATGTGSSVLKGGAGGDTYLVYKASTITEAAGGASTPSSCRTTPSRRPSCRPRTSR